MDDILESLSALPHRYSTSKNEHRAAEYLRQKLEGMGLETHLEPFVARTSFSTVYFIIYFIFLLSVGIGHYNEIVATILALAASFLFFGEQTTKSSFLSQWVPEDLSHNVVAKIPGRGMPKGRLVLVAHYDTSKTGLLFHPRMAAGIKRAFIVSVVMVGIILAGSIARHFISGQPERILGYAMLIPGAYMLFLCLGMFERELRGRPVNGANDNASGVAVVMELAKRITEREGLQGLETTVLLTGSEEVGMAGMVRFLSEREKRLDRNNTVFLNFDSVGGGELGFLESDGMLISYPADPGLLSMARKIAKNDDRYSDIRAKSVNALPCDSLPAAARGYRTLTLSGSDERGVPSNWHWHDDVLDNVDRSVMEKAADFGWSLVEKLETEEGRA